MLRKVLVADRGVTGARIVRTCEDLGLSAVAAAACEATGSAATADALVAAADEAGADAVHPGHGPLACDASVAAAVLDHGLAWIGPQPSAARRLLDSAAVRASAARAGVRTAVGAGPGPVRRVDAECLADAAGTVVVVSTRDRTPGHLGGPIVEEAPAPFLSGEHEAVLRGVCTAVLRDAGYVGIATCSFTVSGAGPVSFVDVAAGPARSRAVEQVADVDVVFEHIRVVDGHPLTYDRLPAHGHALALRVCGGADTILVFGADRDVVLRRAADALEDPRVGGGAPPAAAPWQPDRLAEAG
ncbi:biotin carboxylase N-terminal domain-containing protein [Saccharomonospora sp. CUA-673]|uniref:biotin carboxylase N-terminal domain-containing protein n=1 Tax=Saccharomonospora sp. CUA-673 TaxID=1904969 RepID=UPI000A6FB9EF|nr:biotin carboxylase N-terminal domain-containing protein [Saccharomonospora sp. CUA-673]